MVNFSGLKVKFVKNHINLDSSRPLFQFQGTLIKILNSKIGGQVYQNGHICCDSLKWPDLAIFSQKWMIMRKLTRKIEEKHEKYRARSWCGALDESITMFDNIIFVDNLIWADNRWWRNQSNQTDKWNSQIAHCKK